jgi:hypothetical protein
VTPCRLVEIYIRFAEHVVSFMPKMEQRIPLIFTYICSRKHGVISADIGRNMDYVEQAR